MSECFMIPEGITPDKGILKKAIEFVETFKPYELRDKAKLPLFFDECSRVFYLICHLKSKKLVSKTDLEAVLDPAESDEYKFNRDIYIDSYAYKMMESDALKGRSFEDLVVEFDTSYKSEKPLKVFGGQHRIKAIAEASKKNVYAMHGVRVYFNLSQEQKLNIARVNNTSIAVANDLLDRMQEDFLGTELRNWSQSVGLLKEGKNFADRRDPEGTPTVRIARTLIVNFYKGKHAKEGDFLMPIVCASGREVDTSYSEIRKEIDWTDKSLKTMGQEFTKLHKMQRESVLDRDTNSHIEFANKMIHPCVTASWAFATGVFQSNSALLKAHYSLAESVEAPNDPLNAKDLSKARLGPADSDTYRGLGARINSEELGRMLEVFLLQARARERGITLKLANAAIKNFHARKATYEAKKDEAKIV